LFCYHNIEEVKRRLLTLYNSFVFFQTYVKKEEFPVDDFPKSPENILDKWIISKFNSLLKKVTENLDKYNPGTAIIAVEDFFINDLSLWYLRRSRQRFHPSTSFDVAQDKSSGQVEKDNKEAVQTFYNLLLGLLKIIAPVMPFFAEGIYQELKSDKMPESVHLIDWSEVDKKKIDKELEEKMDEVREIVNLVLAERTALGIKVRQPLSELKIKNLELNKEKELLEILKEEVNVREIIFDKSLSKEIELNTELTDELKKEGIKREVIRQIRNLRKELRILPQDITASIVSTTSDLGMTTDELLKEAGAKNFIEVKNKEEMDADVKKEIKIGGKTQYIGLKK